MQQAELSTCLIEVSELPAMFADFMERSTLGEKQVLFVVLEEYGKRRGAFRLKRALAAIVRKLGIR